MKKIRSFIIVVTIGVLVIVSFAYSGIYDISASSPHSSITNWLFSTTSHASIKRSAKDINVPNLHDDALVLAGVNDFSEMCLGCHGAPGQSPEAMGLGLNPPPPDLSESALIMSSAELFWVTKHGIKMTGMPAWGATHDDDSIWPVVAFIKKLPDLGVTQYQDLLARAKGMGHHTDNSTNREHSHEGKAIEIPSHYDDNYENDDSEQSEDLRPEPEKHDHSKHDHSSK